MSKIRTDHYYSDYLQLDDILNAQTLQSEEAGLPAHDEMLFIITHQAYELWFKQIIFELDSVAAFFGRGAVNDHSTGMAISVHRLKRVCEIFHLLIDQITVLETMTPLDFLDFRNMITPASGFQSAQFRHIEALLGLKMEGRHGRDYYLEQFRKDDIDELQQTEKRPTILQLVEDWLVRFPFFDTAYWSEYAPLQGKNDFWQDYLHLYGESLSERENRDQKMEQFRTDFLAADRSSQVNRSALFIMLFRDFPILQQPFTLLDTLIEIDQLMATWRYRHMTMVRRMIGLRTGTGGTTGKGYLAGAARQNYVFDEFASLATYLIERRHLPTLPLYLREELSFIRR